MVRQTLEFFTKELTKETFPDFEKLFDKHPAPGAFICSCMYHHTSDLSPSDKEESSRIKIAERNRSRKKELVEKRRSHGIVVYARGEPVGWCQYGPRDELPRIDNNRSYQKFVIEGEKKRFWRITCFTVERMYRRRGVAKAGLRAAIEAIGKKGGGLVEAYPIRRWGAYREYLGTLAMFQKEGFKIVAPFGKSNVVVQRII